MIRWLLTIATLTSSPAALAYFQMDLLSGKRGARKSAGSKWTLADWLSQKKNAALADHWLAMHRSSDLLELNLSTAHDRRWTKPDGGGASFETDGAQYQGEIFLSIFGIAGEFSRLRPDVESYGGSTGIRLLGAHSQTTSFVVRYGWRRLTDHVARVHFDNFFAEGVFDLYLFNQFGLGGEYRQYLAPEKDAGDFQGSRWSGGTFVEIGDRVRLFARVYREPARTAVNGLSSRQTHEGYSAGVKLFL